MSSATGTGTRGREAAQDALALFAEPPAEKWLNRSFRDMESLLKSLGRHGWKEVKVGRKKAR